MTLETALELVQVVLLVLLYAELKRRRNGQP